MGPARVQQGVEKYIAPPNGEQEGRVAKNHVGWELLLQPFLENMIQRTQLCHNLQ